MVNGYSNKGGGGDSANIQSFGHTAKATTCVGLWDYNGLYHIGSGKLEHGSLSLHIQPAQHSPPMATSASLGSLGMIDVQGATCTSYSSC